MKDNRPQKAPLNKKPIIIAVCGKGGVGKTSISALIVRQLIELGDKRVLAIDADPAIGLATSLGVEAAKTVDDIRCDVIRRSREERSDRMEVLSLIDYEFMEAMVDKNGYAFLAIGRPESEGCYCKVNEFLRAVIESITDKFDYVVIDGEAGIEQISRRVMERVTHLLLVSDCSKKGINVISTIAKVAEQSVEYEKIGALINMFKPCCELETSALKDIEIIGKLPEDEILRQYDIQGKSLLEFEDNQTTQCLSEALNKFCVL